MVIIKEILNFEAHVLHKMQNIFKGEKKLDLKLFATLTTRATLTTMIAMKTTIIMMIMIIILMTMMMTIITTILMTTMKTNFHCDVEINT